ncbi:ABC transporter, transmembrane region, type 1 [Desulforamulus reducens MI-1]|uniref:ABC transporter, transmembrane region, type 1 n=1 Tax=Desulforamulus reducens (strain ATCC BAA-1160 / DSM 100696 / MI-1) TaxID=349161 RepID=A4J516_DESRM|nr:thiol reductant ABC exporter subunit CydD [Desulforamulus reducens]ABO50169.1 ABC transporter, transmembrane region, type 1 [Desulforamulus reducens MI-1]
MIDKRLLKEARKVRLFLALTIGLGIATGLLVVLQAKTMASIVSQVFIENAHLAQVQSPLLLLLGFMVSRAFLAWFSEVSAHRVAALIKGDLRRRLLQHLYDLGPIHARGERTGELTNLMLEGIESLEDYFAKYLPQLVLVATVPCIILVFVVPIDLASGLILLFTAPLIPFFMILIGKWADHLTKRQWSLLSRLSAHFLDVLQGLATLKLFGRSKDQIRIIGRLSDDFRRTTMGVLRVAFLSALVLELLSTISTALVAVALGLRLVYGHISFESAFFLILLAPEFYLPLRLLGTQFHAGMNGVQAANRIYEILNKPAPRNISGIKVEKPEKIHLSLREVHFSYHEASPILQGISFDLCPGQRVALVGPSGAGKSTLVNLLMGFIQPTQGTIEVNGIPLENLAGNAWRHMIALVPQNPYIFYGTVAENILLGRPQATMDEVVDAAKRAEIHDFIKDLPQGYATPVGEHGLRLSGGQAQRLVIARAFLKNAPVLVLDEATAGLDPFTELAIQETLEQLIVGRTVLVIAHRLATVYGAERILVLREGKLVEQGQHQQLMAQQGVYYDLVKAYRGEKG